MIKLPQKRSHLAEEIFIDVTPLVDVMLILLLFFLLMVNVSQQAYPVKLPESDPSFHKQMNDETPIKVTLFEDGTFAIGKTKYTNIKSVKSEIAFAIRQKPMQKIIVIPDSHSKSGTLISLLTFFEGNNIKNVDILIENGK